MRWFTDASATQRLWGTDRYQTALQISKESFSASTKVFIATGWDFPDALAGSALAGYLEAPILLTRPDRLPDGLLEELDRLGAKDVFILGGEGAVLREVKTALESRASDS